ncbi:uncharacterized protein EV420DRAFT_773613 [Desarmillaria tabescens]|uniref:Uncharacterized protein n=1 Tax=Armillaria tabescens TaxID=1929756 RepID=A0AA39JVU3_ARMTA|nr:uncharacterized protein EV420DRAFT_773613 [Desarmillaria tabescens]KAK0449532.1 hypothetical protein EV420DRAFT_773613 [Desarmillaria tabescens]
MLDEVVIPEGNNLNTAKSCNKKVMLAAINEFLCLQHITSKNFDLQAGGEERLWLRQTRISDETQMVSNDPAVTPTHGTSDFPAAIRLLVAVSPSEQTLYSLGMNLVICSRLQLRLRTPASDLSAFNSWKLPVLIVLPHLSQQSQLQRNYGWSPGLSHVLHRHSHSRLGRFPSKKDASFLFMLTQHNDEILETMCRSGNLLSKVLASTRVTTIALPLPLNNDELGILARGLTCVVGCM